MSSNSRSRLLCIPDQTLCNRLRITHQTPGSQKAGHFYFGKIFRGGGLILGLEVDKEMLKEQVIFHSLRFQNTHNETVCLCDP